MLQAPDGSFYVTKVISDSASVEANISNTSSTIASNFIGLSVENSDFLQGYYQNTTGAWPTGTADSFIKYTNLLGTSGVFRIGGSSADTTTPPVITSGMASSLNTFLTGLGWDLMYNLDLLGSNNPTAAATTATTISSAVSNPIYQFGNEPSLGSPLNNANFITRWNSYYSSVNTALPGVKVAAIDSYLNAGWGDFATTVAALTPGISGMSAVTYHWYPYCRGVLSANPAIEISETLTQPYVRGVGGLGGYITDFIGKYGNVPVRMTETNSNCAQGISGQSDRLVSSIWFILLASVLANNGWQGLNVHNVFNNGTTSYYNVYNVVNGTFTPTPVWLGMYLFSQLVGKQIISSTTSGTGNIHSIAVKNSSGNATILVSNINANNSVTVVPNQSSTWTTGTMLHLQGYGATDPNPVINGKPITNSTWNVGTTITPGTSVYLGPCESVLITING